MVERADVLTFHTPLTDQTRGMLDRARLARMKPGSLIVNCGRGGVVDEAALLEALESGHIGGAGLDVFSKEPPTDFALVQHPKVVATPHIGAQTLEAQERVGSEISRMVLAALEGSLAVSAVNLPFRPAGARGEPFLRLGEQLGRLASGLAGGGLTSLRVDLFGIDEALAVPISVAALRGALVPFLGEAVNYVNAQTLAKERGVELVRATSAASGEYRQLVGVCLAGSAGEVQIAGTLHDDRDPRVVRLGDFALECRAEGLLLVMRNRDVPGVVGRIGTLLGEAQVNIADIHLARRHRGGEAIGEAMAVLRIDSEPSEEALASLRALPEVQQVNVVDLRP
jgi:D-3-phosphoglycerate dehydrogenase